MSRFARQRDTHVNPITHGFAMSGSKPSHQQQTQLQQYQTQNPSSASRFRRLSMSRFARQRDTHVNPITHGFAMSGSKPSHQQQTQLQQYQTQNPSSASRFRRCVDGYQHVCADGHSHATEAEVVQCIDAHRVYVCATNHMHTEKDGAERCDHIKREEDAFKDKELQRKHDREMMDKQIKLTENLRKMDWNFQKNGMPRLEWRD